MKLFDALKRAGSDFTEDECMVSGAALAYYTIFSLPPLLVIVFAIAGWFGVSHSTIDTLVKKQLGMPIAQLDPGTSDAEQDPGKTEAEPKRDAQSALGIFSRVVGIGVLVFSATGLFAQLQHALNRAWEVEPDPERSGILTFALKRLLSLGMVVVIAFLLLVSLVLTTLVDEAVRFVEGSAPDGISITFGIILNNVIVIALASFLFAAMFKVLPDAITKWRDLWVGAVLTAVMFVIGKTGIGWYLQNSQIGSGWGSAAASMVAVLVWVYYSSLIVLFGAEFTQAWAMEAGDGIRPQKGAVHVNERGKSKPAPELPATVSRDAS